MTTAHARKSEIRELMDANGLTYTEAAQWLADPGNELLCETCGWTVSMICPECEKGCGCESYRCSGWRHHEYREEDPDHHEWECQECGATDDYQCHCPDDYGL